MSSVALTVALLLFFFSIPNFISLTLYTLFFLFLSLFFDIYIFLRSVRMWVCLRRLQCIASVFFTHNSKLWKAPSWKLVDAKIYWNRIATNQFVWLCKRIYTSIIYFISNALRYGAARKKPDIFLSKKSKSFRSSAFFSCAVHIWKFSVTFFSGCKMCFCP